MLEVGMDRGQDLK